MAKLVYGVGTNDSDYAVQKKTYCKQTKKYTKIWECRFYRTWFEMLRRCFSEKWLQKKPSYKDCKVCEEWLTFSNFKSWMEKQDWEGKHLDKDLLGDGKLYSPETCCFLEQRVNSFIATSKGGNKEGCFYDTRSGKYTSYCNNPFAKKLVHLGGFDTQEEAHLAWKKKKLEFAKIISEELDERCAKALINRYSR